MVVPSPLAFNVSFEGVPVIWVKQFVVSEVLRYTGRLRKLYIGSWGFKRHFLRPLHFLHPLSGGCRTRLSISSWDEQACLRDGWAHQNGWNFGKVPNGLWPPPLIFGKSCCGFRDKIATKVRMFIMADCCVLYDPISHEMHDVQQFNVVFGWKHTLNKPFCIIFMLKKPYLKVQICNINLWIGNDPPPTPHPPT